MGHLRYWFLCVFALVACGAPSGGEIRLPPPDSGVPSACEDIHSVYATLDLNGPELLHAAGSLVDAPSVPGALEVVDADGVVLATTSLPVLAGPTIIAPTEEEGGDAATEPVDGIVRVVAPWPAGAVALRYQGVSFEVDACNTQRKRKATGVTDVVRSGPDAERMNLLILGDGFTDSAADSALFATNAQKVADRFLSTSPFKEYKDFINVLSIRSISRDNGASKPEGPVRDTAFSCHFDCSGVRRVICCDGRDVARAASALDKVDLLLVMVNDTEYGGAGTEAYATASLGGGKVDQVAVHELGHQTTLGDEYSYGVPSGNWTLGPNCSESGSTTPWEPWRAEAHIDAFPVCGLTSRFRPTENTCLMRALEHGHFCEVCRDHLVRWIYSRTPRTAWRRTPTPRSAEVSVGEELEVGVLRPTPDTLSFNWSATSGGAVMDDGSIAEVTACSDETTVRVEVDDTTPWVRVGRPSVLKRSVEWELQCVDAPDPDLLLRVTGHVGAEMFRYVDSGGSALTVFAEAGRRLRFELDGEGSGDAEKDVDLYWSEDGPPTLEENDGSSFGFGGERFHYTPQSSTMLTFGVYGRESSDFELRVYNDPL